MTEASSQLNEISYVERAIYRYLKGFFQGLDVLMSEKYRAYSFTTFFAALITSCVLAVNNIIGGQISQDYIRLILLGEAIFALAILITAVVGHFIARKPFLTYLVTLCLVAVLFLGVFSEYLFLEYLTDELLFTLARIVFYSWMVFLSASFLGVIRSFFAEWYGAVVWAGNPEGRILFSPIVRLGLLFSVGLPLYAGYKALTDPVWVLVAVPAVLSFVITLIAVFIIPKQKKGNVFGTILSFFYVWSLYHGVTSFVRDTSSPIIFVDAILLTIGAIYSVQAMAKRAARFKNPLIRRVQEERWVMIILAMGLAYHVTSLVPFIQEGTGDTISIFHMGSFVACSLIILLVIVFYHVSSRFHAWIVNMPTTQEALTEVLTLYGPQAAKMAITALLSASREKMEDVVGVIPDTVSTVGRRIFDWFVGKSQKTNESENDTDV